MYFILSKSLYHRLAFVSHSMVNSCKYAMWQVDFCIGPYRNIRLITVFDNQTYISLGLVDHWYLLVDPILAAEVNLVKYMHPTGFNLSPLFFIVFIIIYNCLSSQEGCDRFQYQLCLWEQPLTCEYHLGVTLQVQDFQPSLGVFLMKLCLFRSTSKLLVILLLKSWTLLLEIAAISKMI